MGVFKVISYRCATGFHVLESEFASVSLYMIEIDL